MRCIALDRLDEVRDQVTAAFQLHLDLRPRVLGAVAEPDEPVVEEHTDQHEQHDRGRNDDPGHAVSFSIERAGRSSSRAAEKRREVAERLVEP